MKHLLTLVTLLLLLSHCSKKEVITPCYKCLSAVTYSTNSPTFVVPSPSTDEKSTCDEQEKNLYEIKIVSSQTLDGGYTLTRTAQTVCSRSN